MDNARTQTGFDLSSGIAAALFPGLGHVLQGERKRGLYAGVGILGLFLGGLFIGGIDVIDSKEDRLWFFGQAMVGPLAFGVDYAHQRFFKGFDGTERRSGYPGEALVDGHWVEQPGAVPPNRTSVGKMNELGTLYVCIAGMLNFIVVLDAMFPSQRRES